MSKNEEISEHYSHGSLLEAIHAAITESGKSVDDITIEDLSPVDEFHIGGREATNNFMEQFNFTENGHILDVGCGLGGASRFVADKYNNHVTGIDLTQDYIETGNALCALLKLDERITLHHGSATAMPFQDETFDGGFMMHVGMNIENKIQLFNEIHRVLRPGAPFGVYDVMRIKDGELTYPVPWATDSSSSFLSTPEQYKQALVNAGFDVTEENNRRSYALDFFEQLRRKTDANGSPPPLGLHTLIQEGFSEKIQNMIENVSKEYVAPVEIIAKRI